MILRFLFYVFLFYMLYKLLFDFIIPVFKATRQVKRGFRQMQDHMNQQAGQQKQAGTVKQQPSNDKTQAGEYIDFEEIK
jgi:hypothetical protein